MAQEPAMAAQLCRLCLRNDSDCCPIFFYDEDGNLSEIPEIVKSCLGIEVHVEDGFPKLICQRCKTFLLAFNSFKESCLDSQLRLKSLVCRTQDIELRNLAEQAILEEESRPILKDNGAEENMKVRATKNGGSFFEDDGGDEEDDVKPLAIWTVSQNGKFKSNTSSTKEEIIISELLEEITPTEEVLMEKDAAEEICTENYLSHLEHHNYCIPSPRINGQSDKHEEEISIADEEEWIKLANEDSTVLPESLRRPLAVKQKTKTYILKKEEGNKSLIESSSLVDKFPKVTLGPLVVKQKTRSCNMKMEEGNNSFIESGSLVDNFPKVTPGITIKRSNVAGESKKRILINQNSKQVLRIPAVQAEPINDKCQSESVLKVTRTLRHIEEGIMQELKRKVTTKDITKPSKTFLITKGKETLKIVQNGIGKSNVCLLRIKQNQSPLLTNKPSR